MQFHAMSRYYFVNANTVQSESMEIGDIEDMGKMATMQHILPFLGVMEVKFKFEDKFYTVN